MQYMKHLVFNLYTKHYTVIYKIYSCRLTIIMYYYYLYCTMIAFSF